MAKYMKCKHIVQVPSTLVEGNVAADCDAKADPECPKKPIRKNLKKRMATATCWKVPAEQEKKAEVVPIAEIPVEPKPDGA